MPHRALLNRGLYAITNAISDTSELLDKTRRIIAGGAVLVQYRNPQASPDLQTRQARQLAALCEEYRVPLIINDDPLLAAAVGAAGVHLGMGDASIAAARAIVGAEAIIGCSCYADLRIAQTVTAAGADYLAFGAFFASPSKPGAARADPAVLGAAKRLCRLPAVAIGGITPDNGKVLVDAGADSLAASSGVYASKTPAATARAYR